MLGCIRYMDLAVHTDDTDKGSCLLSKTKNNESFPRDNEQACLLSGSH